MHKILVVDDDHMLREAYALLLDAAGKSVTTAVDGKDALRQVRKDMPDLILLDMVMPNLDGVGFLEALDLARVKQDVKVIIFSNLSTSDKIDQAMELGAQKHITKSRLTPKELVTEIDNLLAAKPATD